MNRTQEVVLDSCVVIDLMEKKCLARKIRALLRGKSVKIILCDVVLNEVQKVRRFSVDQIISQITRLVGKNVTVSFTDDNQRAIADSITFQYQMCHNGDNLILALCQTKNYVLLTFDRMLLQTCGFVGVAAFRPDRAGGM